MRASIVCALIAAAASVAHADPLGAPSFVAGPRTFVAFAGAAATVRLAWSPVAGAARYRVRIAGASPTEVVAPAVDRTELRAGVHRVSVTAIGADGREGAAGDAEITIVAVDAFAPGADHTVPAPNHAFSVGARFESPGLACELGASKGSEVIATTPGVFTLRCGGERDQPLVEVPVVITPVHVSADTAPIIRGTRAEVHVTVASTAAIGDRLTVEAIGALDLGVPERTDGGLDVRVTPRESGIGGLVIKAGTVELGRISLDLAEPAPPPAPETVETRWAAFDVGVLVGGLFTPGEGTEAILLGHPTDYRDTIKTGPTVGARLGFFPTRRLGVEAEVAFGAMGYESRQGIAPLLIARGQLAIRVIEDGQLGLRALLGGDVFSVLSSAGTSSTGSLGGVHYGGAFSVETRRDVSVRFQLLHVITVAQDAGFAHCFEVSAGVVVRLGRRDRWN